MTWVEPAPSQQEPKTMRVPDFERPRTPRRRSDEEIEGFYRHHRLNDRLLWFASLLDTAIYTILAIGAALSG
jgi:hypothetical protein